MHLSENEGIEGRTFAVTGGLGFLGAALCLELVRRGAAEVRSLDARSDSPWSPDLRKSGVRCIQGDVCRRKDVERALRGADCVFHLASHGMSGKAMVQSGRTHEVNINGTCNILEACHELGVKRLVYASTYNVVFGGQEIVNGNESLPYFPIDDHVDPYGKSKSLAEQLVLKSNGRPSKFSCQYVRIFEPIT
uniref:Short-chain dehydrogenase/reductase family 42E member 1 n=1 Tax=Anthurium amnicola TaxID=1678845 RepID=A0A1D1Y644_9ARAE